MSVGSWNSDREEEDGGAVGDSLTLVGLPKWEEWEWNDCEEQGGVKATIGMTYLEKLYIKNCKLSHLPPGLASIKRLALRGLYMYELTNITALENFPSVVELDVFGCPELKTISNLSKVQKIRIVRCPNLLVLEGVPALDSIMLHNGEMEALPDYLAVVNPRVKYAGGPRSWLGVSSRSPK